MRVDSASRFIAAAPEDVFDAFTNPARMLQWLPPQCMTGRFERFDPMAGYRLVLAYDDPPEHGGKASDSSDVADVRRTESHRPERIVEEVDFPSDDPAFAGTMTMTWSFEPQAAGTLVTVEARDVPEGIDPQEHVEGISSSLANLARLFG